MHNESKLMDLVDPNLHLHGDELVVVQRAINVALLCLLTEAERRPTMGRVVASLQGDRTELEVVVSDIGLGNLDKLYEDLLDAAHSGTGVAAIVSETSPLYSGSSSMVVSSSANPMIANIELSVCDKCKSYM